jgi:hypothetical protein
VGWLIVKHKVVHFIAINRSAEFLLQVADEGGEVADLAEIGGRHRGNDEG